MKHSVIFVFLIFILLKTSTLLSQEISDNSSKQDEIANSQIKEKIFNLNLNFDQSIKELDLKKNLINESQLEVIKSKNTLLLLNDLPLSLDEKNEILSGIENDLKNQNTIYNQRINEQLNIIKSIKDDYELISINKNSSENEKNIDSKIEKLYVNFLKLEDDIGNDLNQVEFEEYEFIDSKILDIKELMAEAKLDSDFQNLQIIKETLNNAEFQKAKIDNRILILDNKEINLIEEEKNLILESLNINADIEVSETKLNDKIETIQEDILSLKSQIKISNKEFIDNNKVLNEVYISLKKLNKSLRYGEYLITTEGLLVSFEQEETKIKRKILELENKKNTINNLIKNLGEEIKSKDDEVLKTFNQTSELKGAQIKIDAKISRINKESLDFNLVNNENKEKLADNNNIIKIKTKELEELYDTPRIGKYVLTKGGSLLSFDELEERILNKIVDLEQNNQAINNKINILENKIKLKDEELQKTKDDILIEVKKILNQEKILQSILKLQSDLELKITDAEKKLKKAKLLGDLKMIAEALENKNLIESKLNVSRSELSKAKNLKRQKEIEYERDKKISNPNLKLEDKISIQSQYKNALDIIDLENKKLDLNLKSLLNKAKLIQMEESLLAELKELEKVIKQARIDGDIDTINKAIEKKIETETNIKITRTEIEIGKNKEEEKLLEFDRDIKLSNPALDIDQRRDIQNQYSKYLNKLDMMNKRLEKTINQLDNLIELEQEEANLLSELKDAEKELKQARMQGDKNKIYDALKKKVTAESKIKIKRAEIEISKNKEEEKLLEFERDYNLSNSSMKKDQRKNIHINYSQSKKKLNQIKNILKNSIQSSEKETKLLQNNMELTNAKQILEQAREEGDLEKLNEALKNFNKLEQKLKDIETEIADLNINKVKENKSNDFSEVLKKIINSSQENIKLINETSNEEKKVFMKSGQVYSSEYNRIFDGPSPREKEALKKRIKKGVSKNVNVLSNNLLILNDGELIIIPMQDIIGRSDQELTSIINTAFNPQISLYEIRDKVKAEIKTEKKKKNSNEENSKKQNSPIQDKNEIKIDESMSIDNIISEAREEVKTAIKNEIVKADEKAALAHAIAEKASKQLAKAQAAAEKAAKDLAEAQLSAAQEAAAKAAYDKANEVLEAAIKTAAEKASEAAKAAAQAAIDKKLADAADLVLIAAENATEAKEIAKDQAKNYYDSLSTLAPTDPNRMAAYNDYVAKEDAWKLAVVEEEAKDDDFDAATKKSNEAKAASDIATKESNDAKVVKENAEKDAAEKKKLCTIC